MDLPARISKYELLQFLGGGMSHVYRATDTVLRRTVAVKILTEQGCSDKESKARFLQEAIMAGNIQHENIIKVHDYGEENGRPFIVMEFLTGEDLRDAIRNGHTGDLKNRMTIALQIAKALEYVHSQKIIHRDIKPENIHLDPTGRVRLMDFGIAKSEGFSMTKTGFALGTPYYMAPEQVLGHPATERVDVYAFGILMYELVTGTKPVTGDSVERLFYMILNEPLDMSRLQAAGAPESVSNLVAACTAKKPEERLAGFGPVVAQLERIITDLGGTLPGRSNHGSSPSVEKTAPYVQKPPDGSPESQAPPPSNAKLLTAIGLIALIGIAGGVGIYLKLHPAGTTTDIGTITKPPDKPQSGKAPPPEIETDSGSMVLIPAGKFLFGEANSEVTLPAFYVDTTEVPNEAYRKFCQAKHLPLPDHFPKDRPRDPVVWITIVDAEEYAKWAGKRLPTKQEWEKATRGTDGRPYSWGTDPTPERANVADNPESKGKSLMSVDSNGSSAGPSHLLNTTGNAWEYVSDRITPSQRVIDSYSFLKPPPTANEAWYSVKGGSFMYPLKAAVAYEWWPVPARAKSADIGFRCVKDVP